MGKKQKRERIFVYERRKLKGEVVKITLVFVGLLLGSWCMAQEPWRPPLFFLAIMGLLLGFNTQASPSAEDSGKAQGSGRLWGLAAGDRVYGLCCPLLVKLRTPLGQRAVPRSRMASTTRAWYSQAVVNTTRWLMQAIRHAALPCVPMVSWT